ncbi:MAG: glycosyltransferase [Terriglobia bacterium]
MQLAERLGVAVVEAMAAGLPVIVSNQVGIHGDVLKAHAGLVVECDVQQLGSALTELVCNASLRAAMGANAAALARQFAPGISTASLVTEYARVTRQSYNPR